MISVGEFKFELVENYRECFVMEEFENLFTEYFYDFDYIVGDYAYSKLRLKGFYDDKNKKVKKINNFNNIDKYLEENCARDCKYFIVKKGE